MNSLWSETSIIDGLPQLKGDVSTDVLIIGGGLAGLICASFLKNAGVVNMLVEGNKIGGGITKNTTAKITSQHGLIYHRLLKCAGAEKARMYLDANQWALGEYKKLCSGINCDFEEKDAYVYSINDRSIIETELSALHKIGFNAEFTDSAPLPFQIAGAVKFSNQAQFHPLKFMAGLVKGLDIYEDTFVKELAPHAAITNHGTITAKHIIIASHFPFLNKHGGYFLKMYQHRSYCIALENALDLNGMYLEEKDDGLSFRNYNGFLLIGGGDHKTGKPGGNWQAVRDFISKRYPGSIEKYSWAAQDCMTLDNVPYIGPYGKSTEGLYVATGFNKWGMTSSMVSALILSDMILGRKNAFAEVFSPQRSIWKPQLLVNGLAAAGNLMAPSAPRCPHMGCALRWNSAENSWDCPCHGSRFEEGGKLIDNPAIKGLKR